MPQSAILAPIKENANKDRPQVVKLYGLKKHYRQAQEVVRAVDGIDLCVSSVDFVLITGRSGSGKTTLLSLIGGLTKPTAGEVMIQGENLVKMGDAQLSTLRARGIGYVFQFASLIPTLTALDNVRLPGLFSGKKPDVKEAQELLAWVGLAGKASSYPSQLSGGQQTRVAVARALVNHPPLLLADEPTGSLDHETEQEIMQLLARINKEMGVTIILVTHNPDLAVYANRHLVMDNGQVVEVEPGF